MDLFCKMHQELTKDPISTDTLVILLKTINEQDTDSKDITDQQRIDLIVQGTAVIPIDHVASSAFCQLIFKQCTKYIRLSSFRSSSFEKCMDYVLNGLEVVDLSAEHRVDILRALSSLLYDNSTNTLKYYPRLIPMLLSYSDRDVKPLEIRRMAINCLGNACIGAGPKLQPYFKSIYDLLIASLCGADHLTNCLTATSSFDLTDPASRKIASSTLRALQFVLLQHRPVFDSSQIDILSIVHNFIFTQVNVYSYQVLQTLAMDDKANITMTLQRSLHKRLLNRQRIPASSTVACHQRSIGRTMPNTTSSSESELSDPDSGVVSLRRVRDEAKIRTNALLCLLAIAKTNPRYLYPHWHRFIPDTFSSFFKNNANGQTLAPSLKSDRQPPSLMTVLLYDPQPSVRKSVCYILMAMLNNSKQYLSVASERNIKSSFTSLSENLASILRDLHLGLEQALIKEQDTEILCLIMNVVSQLVSNVSYDRLATGYLSRFYQKLMDLLKRFAKSASTLSCIIQTLSAMAAVTSDEMEVLLVRGNESNGTLMAFLISVVQDKHVENLLQQDAWSMLSICAKCHFKSLFYGSWEQLEACVDEAILDEDEQIRRASMYFIESYASAFAAMCNQSSLDTNKMTTCISWWQSNLEKHIQQSSLDPSPKVKVATCDCLAAISSSIFEQLPMRYQRLSIALLMPLTEDPDAAVRAAACRAIGVFILFPTLREDECFVSDVTTVVLNGMSDPSLLVRLRVSWAQGNLSDSLIITSQTTEDFNLPEWITFKDWNRMLEIASHAAMDNDKLRPNAVRSLGGILRIAPLSYFERRESLDVVQSVILAIVKNMETGSLKARWNACHAASNTLKNAAIPIGYVKKNTNVKQYPWTPIFYQTLLHCMTKCANYKVRINACLALASPTDVAQFGDQWEPVYKALIAAWDDIQTLEAGTDFNERKYRSQLKDQLQATLNHIHAWLPPELQAKLNFDK